MKIFLKNHWHQITLAGFLIVHALICSFTTYYGDDYYYANFVRQGADYFVSENIYHYMYTNGRALVHILDELLIGWSFWLWRVFIVATMAMLVIVMAKLAARAYREDIKARFGEYQRAVAGVCGLLSITDVAVLRQSVYWATGSMNYLLPATAMLWFYYLFRRDFERLRGSWLLLIPAFFASATTEQASAGALLVTLCFIVSCMIVRRVPPKPAYIGAFFASLAGFCTLYLSPGNAARTGYYPEFYSLSLLGRAKRNFPELMSVIFGTGGIYPIICVIYLLIIAACLTKYAKSSKRPHRIAALLMTGETAIALGIYVWALRSSPDTLREPWMGLLIAPPLLGVMIYTAVRYFTRGQIDELFFVWCAVALQGAMLFSPEYGPRTLLVSLVCLCVPAVRTLIKLGSPGLYAAMAALIFALLPGYMASPSTFALALVILTALFAAAVIYLKNSPGVVGGFALALCLAQFCTVAAGYGENVGTHALNRKQIEEYQQSDQSVGLVLYYLPNSKYKYTMPYDDLYHQRMLLILCGLAPDTQVWYEFREQQ